MQYHALGLLYIIREKDRMAVTKMIQQLGGSGKGGSSGVLRNPMAICMLIRYASKVMEEDPKWVLATGLMRGALSLTFDLFTAYTNRCTSSWMAYFDTSRIWLTSKLLERFVTCEAYPCQSFSDLSQVSSVWCCPQLPLSANSYKRHALAVLQLFLSSPKPILKFAAIKTLNKLAMTQPGAVAGCNMDIENLITDANRSVATYAITTLLKVRLRKGCAVYFPP
jgi:coatomer protein complex subunit gamma